MTTYKGLSTYNRFKKFRLTDFELAKQDLFNHFHIKKGEKLMNPEFGTIVWNILFEPFTEEIKTAVVEDVKRVVSYDPRLSIDDVQITQYEYGLQINIELTYQPTDQRDVLRLRFDQQSSSATLVN